MQESNGRTHEFGSTEEYKKKLKELGDDLLPLPKRKDIIKEAKQMNRRQRRTYGKLLRKGWRAEEAFDKARE